MPAKTEVFLSEQTLSQVFSIYVNNTLKERESIRDIEFNVIDNQTVNFTVFFQNPYLYGLLNKKNDLLIFECLNETLILANATN